MASSSVIADSSVSASQNEQREVAGTLRRASADLREQRRRRGGAVGHDQDAGRIRHAGIVPPSWSHGNGRIVRRMDDAQIEARIDALEQEEKTLRRDEESQAERGRTDQVGEDAGRLAAIKVELDQLWDLLRQRRALRSAGRDPDEARMRDADTVERYLG